MSARELLQDLRDSGFTVELAEEDRIRIAPASSLPPETLERVRAEKPTLLQVLRVELAQRTLDLAMVRPDTRTAEDVLEQLSDTDPATTDQVDRLRLLASDPEWGPKRPKVEAWAERVVERGVTERGAYLLLGVLGGRLARNGNGRAT